MNWVVVAGVLGITTLALALGGICVTLGMNLQRLTALQSGQETLFKKVDDLQRELKNGITSRLSDHSKEIDVLKMGLLSLKESAHAEAVSIRETCGLRHGGKMSRA